MNEGVDCEKGFLLVLLLSNVLKVMFFISPDLHTSTASMLVTCIK
jgi:hypothetical protein